MQSIHVSILAAALASIASAACGEPGAARPSGRNLLLVSVDTLRADHTSAYGGDVATPALQRLADEGIVFERAYSQAPICTPSRASFLTGMYSSIASSLSPVSALRRSSSICNDRRGSPARR